ncbi:hypothetical protein BGZ94_005410 [Podila epigama]|nr:hypothetical protein BGZ94_005410 [Podila epigama]
MQTSAKSPCVACQTPSITRCARCKINHYCSEKCQRKDWPTHKIACTPAIVDKGNTSNSPSSSSSTSSKASSRTANEKATSSSEPVLPNPSQPLNVKPVKSEREHIKPEPSRTCTDLKFKYQPSDDKMDENLVLFFHGLGDKIEPSFVTLAKSLQLPHTATCCIQAPTPVPYIEQEGWMWYPSFNNLTGDLLGPESPERMNQVRQKIRPNLVSLVRHFIDDCGFESNRIFLFGFSQGASIALDFAAFGGIGLGGVISIAGYFMEESENDSPALAKMPTQVLVVQGDKDNTQSIDTAKKKFNHIERIFGRQNVKQTIVNGMDHGMPSDQTAWQEVMVFFAQNLAVTPRSLVDQADVYEVTN